MPFLIPLQCEFYAMEGLSHLMRTIRRWFESNLNDTLAIQGIVLTMYDKRNKFTDQIERDVRSYFGEQVYWRSHPAQRPHVRGTVARQAGIDLRHALRRFEGAYIQLASEFTQARAQHASRELTAA